MKRLRDGFGFAHGNVLILLTVWALTDLAHYVPETYYSLYVEKLDASTFLLGVILSVASFVMGFLQLAGGYWADKHGRKSLIVSMSFGRVLIYLMFAAAPTWHFILLGEVLLAVSAMSQPAVMAIMADSVPAEKRGLGYSLSLVVGATSIVSPVIAGFLYWMYGVVEGMRLAYVIVALCWLASGVMHLKLTETLKPETGKVSVKEAVRQYPKAVKECVTVWKLVPRPMLYLLLVFTPAGFFVRMCMPYYILYATQLLKVPEFQWALMQTWQSMIFYGLMLPIGKFTDLYGRKKPLLLSSILLATGLALFVFGDVMRLYAFFALCAAGNAMLFTAYSSLQADLTPKEYRGKVMGFTNFIDCISASAALVLGGFLYENVAPAMPFALFLAGLLFTIVATHVFVKEPENKEK